MDDAGLVRLSRERRLRRERRVGDVHELPRVRVEACGRCVIIAGGPDIAWCPRCRVERPRLSKAPQTRRQQGASALKVDADARVRGVLSSAAHPILHCALRPCASRRVRRGIDGSRSL